MAKGFIIYTRCCMGETLAVLMAYNGLGMVRKFNGLWKK
jgi:hypothetical protein